MTKKPKELPPLHAKAKAILDETWEEVLAIESLEKEDDPTWTPLIRLLVESGGSTYPFMLVTQVLGKAADPTRNATCIQDSSTLEGAWDARSLAAQVVVPWNQDVGRPFAGSNNDPYVNNPARGKHFGDDMRAKARRVDEYDALAKVAQQAQDCDHVENDDGKSELRRLLRLILIEARRSLEANKRDYFGPARMSVRGIMSLLQKFLADRSNGVRLQLTCYALYQSLAEAHPTVGQVSSAVTNAADLSSNRTGDVECERDGKTVLAVEVKDRPITEADVNATILKARKNGVTNLLFISGSPLSKTPEEAFTRGESEFAYGIDVNYVSLPQLANNVLLQLSPKQRAAFLRKLHDALHEKGANYRHVRDWMELLKGI